MEEEKFLPDFFIIPRDVAYDEELTPMAVRLYGIIYWLEHLVLGRCIASNDTLADYCKVEKGTIANLLMLLEKRGHIERRFDDKNQRTEIITRHSIIRSVKGGSSNGLRGVHSTDEHISNTYKENIYSFISSKKDEINPPSIPQDDVQDVTVDYLADPETGEPRMGSFGRPYGQQKKKKPNILSGYRELLSWAEEERSKKSGKLFRFAQPLIQFKWMKNIKEAGYEPDDVKEMWLKMQNNPFWVDRGFDFLEVSKELDKQSK